MTAMRIVVGVALLSVLGASAETVDGSLNGKSGKLFKVAPDQRTLEFLKETEYDPKTEAAQSRFTIHWDDGTEVVKLGEWKDFKALEKPALVTFQGIDTANRKALQQGEAFVARVATVFLDADPDAETGISADQNQVLLLREEVGELSKQPFVDRRIREVEVINVLG